MEQILSFKGWMAENNVKQKDLAELLDLSTYSVYLKVNDKRDFTLSEIRKICDAYGVDDNIFLKKKLQTYNMG